MNLAAINTALTPQERENLIALVERLLRKTDRDPVVSFARLLPWLLEKRFITPLVREPILQRISAILATAPFNKQDASPITECFELLRAELISPLMQTKIKVEICRMGPKQKIAAIGSPDDTGVKSGCDDGAGQAYHAKTNLRTVWVAEELLEEKFRTIPAVIRDGPTPITSFTMMSVLHEFAHIYINYSPVDFKQLERLYENARATFLERWPSEQSIASDADDKMEFLAQAFAYENTRVDRAQRRTYYMRVVAGLGGLAGVDVSI